MFARKSLLLGVFYWVIAGLFLGSNLKAEPSLHRNILVFVPAYEASQLWDPDLNGDKDDPACVWGNYNTFLSSNLYFALRMPNPLVAKPLLGVGSIDVYRKFVDTLTQAPDEKSGLHPYTEGSDFFIFTYDWRQEIAMVSAPQFGRALEKYAQIHASKTGLPASQTRFIIVTHSMGGLVARTLLSEKPEWAPRIERLYLVGSPNAGSVKAIRTLVVGPDSLQDHANGFPGGLLNLVPTDVDQSVTKLVGITRPSLYELVPENNPNWEEMQADGKGRHITGPEILQASSWENYWPSAKLEKDLFLDGWLKKHKEADNAAFHLSDWEFCQNPGYPKLRALLAETANWYRIMGPLSETNRLLTQSGSSSRLRVIFSTGLQTPTGVVTMGSHDTSKAYYLYEPANSGDGTMEAKRVLDDISPTASNVFKLQNVPHQKLMINPQFLTYFTRELAEQPIMGVRH